MKFNKLTSAMILGLGLSSAAFAADFTGNANVTLLTAISFAEVDAVEFGQFENQDGTCTMATGAVLSGVCASATGTINDADITVTAEPNTTVSVAVSGGTTDNGVTFTPVLDSSATPTTDGSGNTSVTVIGSLSIASATNGAHNMTYTLSVNYQ